MESGSDEEEELYSRELHVVRAHSSSTSALKALTVFAAIGGFLFGYDTGVISGALVIVRHDLNLDSTWHEMVVSATLIAACITAIFSGPCADRFGRQIPIMASSIAFAIGAFIMAFSYHRITLLVGRLVVGIGVGLASAVVPLYIGECSPADKRGRLVTMNIVAVTLGQLTAGVVCGGLVELSSGWRYMLGIPAFPAILQLALFAWIPESPRYLVKCGKYENAEAVLSALRGPHHQIQDELEDIKIACRRTPPISFFHFLNEFLCQRHSRTSVFLGCLLQFLQQIAGINTIMYYAGSIFKMAGASDFTAVRLSAAPAGVNFIFTLVGLKLVHVMSRRKLLFSSLGVVIIALCSISASFQFMESNDGNGTTLDCVRLANLSVSNENSSLAVGNPTSAIKNESQETFTLHVSTETNDRAVTDLKRSTGDHSNRNETLCTPDMSSSNEDRTSLTGPLLVLSSMCLYLAGFAPGLGHLPWTINAELHPEWCRAHAQGLATSTNWLANLLVSMTFLSVTEGLGRPVAFFTYAIVSVVCGIVLILYLPETKGVKLEEVEQLFSNNPQNFGSASVNIPSGLSSILGGGRSDSRVVYSRLDPT